MAASTDREQPTALLTLSDAQWRCASVNPAWCALAGAPSHALVDETIGALLPDRLVGEALGRLCDLAALTATRRTVTIPAFAGSEWLAVATPELSDEAGTGARIRLELSPLADPPTGPHETPRLLEAGSELVARFDPDLRVVAVNHLVLTVSGLAPEQIIGRTNREMGYPPVIADLWDTHHRQVFRTGRPCALSYTLVTVAGPRPYESRITPEFDADGNVVAVTVRSRPSLLSTEADVPVRGDFAGADEAMWERFEPVPASVAAARARIRAWLVDRAHDPRTTEVTLAVSELATNAIMHAGTEFYVHALRDPAHVRIAVRDGSDALPVLREPGTVGGRGIPLVAALASRWGVDRMPYGGKVVWCEFLDGEPAAPPRLTDAELIDFWSEQ